METRKLNILMRYPINWSVYTVMNNFIQNFYDAVGPEKFATGFKMAALVAYRDLKLGITMESQDWRLVVSEAFQMINGVDEKVLAYDLFSRPYSDTSKLTLTGVNAEQYKQACNTIHSFY